MRRVDGARRGVVLAMVLAMTGGLSGCLVAGYSSRGGAFVWPGGFGLLIVLLVLFLLLRRR